MPATSLALSRRHISSRLALTVGRHVPFVADGRFYLQLLIAAFDQGLSSLPGNNARYNSSRDEWGRNGAHGFNLEVGDARYARESSETIGLRHAISFLMTH